jgi:Family of unknown function (DUF6267)
MIPFKKLISEEAEGEGQKLKHIEHLEDHPINDGAKGFEHSIGALEKVKQHILMKSHSPDLAMKHDGSPSIVYGHHPDTGKFFVASKSAFNKTPKINYTDKDIEKNHGHAPGLVEKLKSALHHLPKIAPKKGVFQGDVLFSDKDKHETDGKYHFKPNTITYSANKNSDEGKKIGPAKFGLYTHTEYRGKDASAMNAHFDPDLSKFKTHKDVYHREPGHDTSKVKMDDDALKNYEDHVHKAVQLHAKHGNQMYGPLDRVRDHVKTYINNTIRTGEKPSPEGLQHHITTQYGKEIDKLKTDKSKNARVDELKSKLNHIETHKQNFNNLFKLHDHLQKAKDTLVHTLSQHTGGLEHSVEGQKVKPEGFVVNHEGQPTKLNDRKEFNRLNFMARK